MKEYLVYFAKGIAIGIANIIPGVSGGTIALIVGIFERLIMAIKSFDLAALKLISKGKWTEFSVKTDFYFLVALFSGVILAIISLARLFEFLFSNYPVFIWSFFFGLILASVYFVGKTIDKWRFSVYFFFIIGATTAITMIFLTPASENSDFFYLILCGVVAVCSMILPGLSGSFVLILMGNYQLVAITAINNWDFGILIPMLIGAVSGLIAFSHFLSWVFKHFKDQTIALLTGFILGSLGVIWPWKTAVKQMFGTNAKVVGYDYFIPEINMDFFVAILLMISGIIIIWWMENNAKKVKKVNQ